MAKIKYTKGELKKQRDALRQYRRYLPTLQLKKQQLQTEILHQASFIEAAELREKQKMRDAEIWAGLLSDPEVDLRRWLS
ncbi:MAG: V-type ATP synthase subunit D, partial [Candidatus Omnitrophica bacterium]|nr:V-type ATP synthase subunit D [Candidatus Omnitrophota bacterium]